MQLEPKRWQVDAAVLRLHSRRCTCLAFHPTKDSLVLSGALKTGRVVLLKSECMRFVLALYEGL